MEEVKTEDKSYCVYMHVNKHNNKKYIGLTFRSPNERWGQNGSEYFKTYPNGKYVHPVFAYALIKYNDWDNDWEHIIVADKLTKDDACQKEIELIAQYKTNVCKWKADAMGYNMTDGGEGLCGYAFTNERKEEYSVKFSGENNPFYGKHHTEETRKRNSEWHKENMFGENNPFYGKKHSEESKRKNSESHRKTAVVQLDKNGDYIAEYESSIDAMKITKVRHSNIINCCRKQCKSAGGFIWQYKDEYDHTNKIVYHDNSKRPVVQLDKDGTFICDYISISEASRITNTNIGSIRNCCLGSGKSAGGYIWVFKENYDPSKTISYVNNNTLSVICFDKNDNYICEYNSLTQAQNDTGADISVIIKCCKGKGKTAGGFKWKYKKDWEEIQSAKNIDSKN